MKTVTARQLFNVTQIGRILAAYMANERGLTVTRETSIQLLICAKGGELEGMRVEFESPTQEPK